MQIENRTKSSYAISMPFSFWTEIDGEKWKIACTMHIYTNNKVIGLCFCNDVRCRQKVLTDKKIGKFANIGNPFMLFERATCLRSHHMLTHRWKKKQGTIACTFPRAHGCIVQWCELLDYYYCNSHCSGYFIFVLLFKMQVRLYEAFDEFTIFTYSMAFGITCTLT